MDESSEMLNIAKKKIKGVRFYKDNMVNFNLKKQFDVITCLFSSVGHLRTYANLRKAIQNFSKHLNKGGVLIIEPFVARPKFKFGSSFTRIQDFKNIKIVWVNNSKKLGNNALLDIHWLISEKNKSVIHLSEKMELALYEKNKILKIMEDAGFKAKFLKKGLMKDRGLYVGVKSNINN